MTPTESASSWLRDQIHVQADGLSGHLESPKCRSARSPSTRWQRAPARDRLPESASWGGTSTMSRVTRGEGRAACPCSGRRLSGRGK